MKCPNHPTEYQPCQYCFGKQQSAASVLLSVDVAYDITRAKEMLQVAADYIRKFYPDGTVHYDDASWLSGVFDVSESWRT